MKQGCGGPLKLFPPVSTRHHGNHEVPWQPPQPGSTGAWEVIWCISPYPTWGQLLGGRGSPTLGQARFTPTWPAAWALSVWGFRVRWEHRYVLHKPLTPYKPSTALEPWATLWFLLSPYQVQKPPPPPPRCSNSDLKVTVSSRHRFWQGTSSGENPTRAVSPRFIFSEGAEASQRWQDAVCVWCTFLISLRSGKLSYTSVFWTPEPLRLHKYLIGQLSKCYFPEPPLAPLLEFSGRLVGETLVRVLFFYFPSVLGGIHIMHNQNNGSIVFYSVFWLLRRKQSHQCVCGCL